MKKALYAAVSLLTGLERKKSLFLLLLMVIAMFLETMSVSLVVPLVGVMMQEDLVITYPAIKPILNFFGNPNQMSIILGAISSLVFIYFFKNCFLGYSLWKQTDFSYKLQHRISKQLFKTYLLQPYTFHLQKNSAELIRNITSEVNLFSFAVNALLLIFAESFVVIGILCALFYIEPLGAFSVVITLSLASFFFIYFTKNKVLQWGQTRQLHDGLRLQHLQQGLGGIKEVKLYGREEDFLSRFSQHNLLSTTISGKQIVLQQLPRLWLEFLTIAGLALLVYILISRQLSMVEIMPILGLFAAAGFRLMPSANRLLGALQTLRFHMPIIHMLREELHANFSEVFSGQVNRGGFKDSIKIQGVTYSYEREGNNALDNVNLSIRKGESVGIIGASGSGKSTVVDMLLGLLAPDNGDIVVDGETIYTQLRVWQKNIGYVPQSIYLTDDSLKCNIAFGLPENEINTQALEQAITAAQLTSFVASLDKGVETVVGERGVRLSGGQRQRIGIARALYHNPEVLVFDEATSALDVETESYVMETINALHGQKTIIIVAHRLSTVMSCDNLYQMDAGKVIASGKPEELIKCAS